VAQSAAARKACICSPAAFCAPWLLETASARHLAAAHDDTRGLSDVKPVQHHRALPTSFAGHTFACASPACKYWARSGPAADMPHSLRLSREAQASMRCTWRDRMSAQQAATAADRMQGTGSRLCMACAPALQLPSTAALRTAVRTPATASDASEYGFSCASRPCNELALLASLPAGGVSTFACTEGMRWRCRGPLTGVCICTEHHPTEHCRDRPLTQVDSRRAQRAARGEETHWKQNMCPHGADTGWSSSSRHTGQVVSSMPAQSGIVIATTDIVVMSG